MSEFAELSNTGTQFVPNKRRKKNTGGGRVEVSPFFLSFCFAFTSGSPEHIRVWVARQSKKRRKRKSRMKKKRRRRSRKESRKRRRTTTRGTRRRTRTSNRRRMKLERNKRKEKEAEKK